MSSGVIPQRLIDTLRNKVAVDTCAPLAFLTIIDWGLEKKPQQESLEDYINGNDLLKKANKGGNWLKVHLAKLKNYQNEDVTFLYNMISIICYDEILKSSTLKDSLKEIKDIRNDYCHEHQRSGDPDTINKLKQAISKSLDSAGQQYGKDVQVIDAAKIKIEDKFQKIFEDTNQYRPAKIQYISRLILGPCFDCNKKKTIDDDVVVLPMAGMDKIRRQEVYCDVIMSDNKASSKTPFLSSELESKVKHKVVFIEGKSGTGKTTLIKTILRSFVDQGQVLTLFIDCKKRAGTNLGSFMKYTFPDILNPFDDQEILDALRSIQSLILLVDGYDEANESSRQLVGDCLKLCKENDNNKCFVSGRLHVMNEFNQTFGMDLDSFRIEVLEEDKQLEIMQKYMKYLKNNGKLEEMFNQLHSSTKKIFETPLLLGSYISVGIEKDFDAAKVNSQIGLYEELFQVFRDKIATKLRANNVNNDRRVSKKLMEELSTLSLKDFNRSKYYIDEDGFENLSDKCEKFFKPDNASFDDIFSSILSPIYDLRKRLVKFEFPHLSIQEHFASETIVKALQDDPASEVTTENMYKYLSLEGQNIQDLRR